MISWQTQRQQTQSRDLTSDEIDRFNAARETARLRLRDNERCRNALARIYKALGGSQFQDYTLRTRDGSATNYSPATAYLYGEVMVNGNRVGRSLHLDDYAYVEMKASTRSGRSGNFTEYGRTTRSVTEQYLVPNAPIQWNREFFGLSREAGALHVLHEILHQRWSDIEIANEIAIENKDKKDGKLKTFTATDAASAYINEHLSAECDLPQN